MSTLVIVPAYNEEDSIEATIDELIAVAPDLDVVIINDGSRDRTRQICEQRGFNIVSHPVNLGLAGAFQTGMKYAYRHGYDFALQFDADGQHVPSYISALLTVMQQQGADIVIGSRFLHEDKPHTLRMAGSSMISALIALTTGAQLSDPTSGMRLYNRRMIEQFATRSDLSPEPDTLAYLIKKQGAQVKEVHVSMRERQAGQSYFTLSRAFMYMATTFTSILFAQWFRR